MEAALERACCVQGRKYTNEEEGAKETAFQPSPTWARDGGAAGAHAINMVRGPQGREGKGAPREWETWQARALRPLDSRTPRPWWLRKEGLALGLVPLVQNEELHIISPGVGGSGGAGGPPAGSVPSPLPNSARCSDPSGEIHSENGCGRKGRR